MFRFIAPDLKSILFQFIPDYSITPSALINTSSNNYSSPQRRVTPHQTMK